MTDQPRKSFGFYNRAEFSEPKPEGPIFRVLPPQRQVQQPPDKPMYGKMGPPGPLYGADGLMCTLPPPQPVRWAKPEDTRPLAYTRLRGASQPQTVARLRELVADNWRARQEARLRRRKVRENWL